MPNRETNPALAAQFSQTKALFDDSARHSKSRYRAPTWSVSSLTKRFTHHHRSISDEQVSPLASPRVMPLETSSSPVPRPRTQDGNEPQSTAKANHVSLLRPSSVSLTETLSPSPLGSPAISPSQIEEDEPSTEIDEPVRRRSTAVSESAIERLRSAVMSINQASRDEHIQRHMPKSTRSRSESNANLQPGYWWMTYDAAECDGMTESCETILSQCPTRNCKVLSLTKGSETVCNEDEEMTTYSFTGPWSSLPLGLISAMSSPVMVLRSDELNSPYAPCKGIRYDGMYHVKQFRNKSVGGPGEELYSVNIILQRIPDQISYEEILDIPHQHQIDDWIVYDRLEFMSDSSGRSRSDLMLELSRESSRRQSASSIETPAPSTQAPNPTPVAPTTPTLTIVPAPAQPTSAPPPPPSPKNVVRKVPDVILEDPLAEEAEERGAPPRRGSNMSGLYQLSSGP